MSILDEFQDLLVHTVDWEQRTGLDSHGAPVYARPKTLKARIAYKQTLVLDQTGKQQVSSCEIWLGESVGVSNLDRITLPTGFLPSRPVILAVRRTPDDTGAVVERLFA